MWSKEAETGRPRRHLATTSQPGVQGPQYGRRRKTQREQTGKERGIAATQETTASVGLGSCLVKSLEVVNHLDLEAAPPPDDKVIASGRPWSGSRTNTVGKSGSARAVAPETPDPNDAGSARAGRECDEGYHAERTSRDPFPRGLVTFTAMASATGKVWRHAPTVGRSHYVLAYARGYHQVTPATVSPRPRLLSAV